MDPDKLVVFAYDGVPAHLDLAIPAQYEHSLCDIDIVEKDLRANPCKNRPKSPIRGKAQKIKIALLLQTGRH